jgi:hypothetical protein
MLKIAIGDAFFVTFFVELQPVIKLKNKTKRQKNRFFFNIFLPIFSQKTANQKVKSAVIKLISQPFYSFNQQKLTKLEADTHNNWNKN